MGAIRRGDAMTRRRHISVSMFTFPWPPCPSDLFSRNFPDDLSLTTIVNDVHDSTLVRLTPL